ncbi:MAG: hypothetical protein FWD63_08310 [Propionibacteriaceae bacterium]|nr:hypothetical protein [Propionibacteriaceae bacterium]
MAVSEATRVAPILRRVVVVCVGLAVALVSGLALSSCAATNVVPDPAFRACLNGLLKQPADSPVTATQLRHLSTGPTCQNLGITSLEGAQYLTHVNTVILPRNQITDLTPLAHLSALQYVFLSNNQIVDLTPLANLKNLVGLDAGYNQIGDLTPLSGLTHLLTLSAEANQISDVTALSPLTGLKTLRLDGNHISNLTPVAQLPVVQSPDLLDFTVQSQHLTASAVAGVPQPLPSVIGLEPATWSIMQGEATIDGDMVTCQTTGTIVLAFNNTYGARFAGLVTVTVT